jgi:hypothetical protein
VSNGITPAAPPNDDPASLGRSLGVFWAINRAGTYEFERLTLAEHENDPHLLRLLESDEAILALVRIIMPPCALHLSSARMYWRQCLSGPEYASLWNNVPFIAGFLGGAIEAAQARARSAVIEAAEDVAEGSGSAPDRESKLGGRQLRHIRERPTPNKNGTR